VSNNFGNRNFMEPCSLLSGVGWGGVSYFVFFFLVFNVFSSCSLEVPKLFSKAGFPKSTSVLFHMVCPKFNSHVYKLKSPSRYWEIHLILFSNWGSKEVLPLGTILLWLMFFMKSKLVRMRSCKFSKLKTQFHKMVLQFCSLYNCTQLGMKQGLEAQTRAQKTGQNLWIKLYCEGKKKTHLSTL
jgi:hypothetical protein